MGKLKEAEATSKRLLAHSHGKINAFLGLPAVVYFYTGREKEAKELMKKYMEELASPSIRTTVIPEVKLPKNTEVKFPL